MTDSVSVPERLASIETKVDMLVERGKAYDDRITNIERKQWKMTGAAGVLAFLASHLNLQFLKFS